jgi:hypothetical protein
MLGRAQFFRDYGHESAFHGSPKLKDERGFSSKIEYLIQNNEIIWGRA